VDWDIQSCCLLLQIRHVPAEKSMQRPLQCRFLLSSRSGDQRCRSAMPFFALGRPLAGSTGPGATARAVQSAVTERERRAVRPCRALASKSNGVSNERRAPREANLPQQNCRPAPTRRGPTGTPRISYPLLSGSRTLWKALTRLADLACACEAVIFTCSPRCVYASTTALPSRFLQASSSISAFTRGLSEDADTAARGGGSGGSDMDAEADVLQLQAAASLMITGCRSRTFFFYQMIFSGGCTARLSK